MNLKNILNSILAKFNSFKLSKKIILVIFFAWLLKLVVVVLFFTFSASAATTLNASYKQVKCSGQNTVYYLDHKNHTKKAYTSESAYLSYGNKWSDVKIIDCSLINDWSEVQLVKAKNSSKIYQIKNGEKKVLTLSEYKKLAKKNKLVTLSIADLNSYKLVSVFNNQKYYGSISGSNLEVSKGSYDNNFLVTGSHNNKILVLKLKANQATTISSLTLTRKGFSTDAVVKSVYITDVDGNRLNVPVTFNNSKAVINFNNNPVVINAGETKTIYVKVDLSDIDADKQNIQIGIDDANDIVSDKTVKGSFPIYNDLVTIYNSNGYLTEVQADVNTLYSSTKNIKIGTKQEKVFSFSIEEAKGIEDIILKKVTIENIGSASDEDLQNFTLVTDKGKTVTTVKNADNHKVIFNLNTGLEIEKNKKQTFYVKADVINGDGEDVKFVINKDYDIEVEGANTGNTLNITADESFPLGQSGSTDRNRFKIERGSIFVSAKTLTEKESKVYRDQNDAIIGEFEIRNNSGDIKLESIKASLAGTGSLDSSIILYDQKKNKQISSLSQTDIKNGSNFDANGYLIKTGETFKIAFKTSIPEGVSSGDTYKMVLNSIVYTNVDDQTKTENVSVNGQTKRVVKPAIYAYTGKFETKDKPVAGATGVKIATFKLESTNEEKVKITSISFTNLANYTSVSYNNGFSNLTLYKGTSKIGTAIEQPSGDSYYFDNLNLTISAGSSIDLNLKADIAAEATGQVGTVLDTITAVGYDSKSPVEIYINNASSISDTLTKSSLTVSATNGGNVTTGSKDNLLGSFLLKNSSIEAVKLQNIVIASDGCTGGLSKNNGYSYLRFATDNNGKTKRIGSGVSTPVAELNKISMSSYKIESGQQLVLNLYVDSAKDTNVCDFTFRMTDIEVIGDSSKQKIGVEGYPTDSVAVKVQKGTTASTTSTTSTTGSTSSTNTTTTNSNKLSWPVSSHTINYHFHDSTYPYIASFQHEGIDIKASQGTSVKAAAAGTVVTVFDGGYSENCSYVEIDHGGGFITVYAHLSEIKVKVGDKVTSGQIIGKSGGTPNAYGSGKYSSGPHLHFEVRINGTAVDPEIYLK